MAQQNTDQIVKNRLPLPPGDVLQRRKCPICGKIYTIFSVKHFRNSDGSVEQFVPVDNDSHHCE